MSSDFPGVSADLAALIAERIVTQHLPELQARLALTIDAAPGRATAELAWEAAKANIDLYLHDPDTISTVNLPRLMVAGEGKVTKPLPARFAALPCGQRLGILAIALAVLLAADLPPDVRDYVAYLLAVISAGIWLAGQVVKK